MRIISGEFRGRKLLGPRGLEMRPTSDRLRETLFDILGASVRGSSFMDVFAGTGAVGIEALSRGATEVIFIEQSAEGCLLIRKNLEACRVSRGYRLLQRDAFTALRQLGREGIATDLVFADPPYRWEHHKDILDIIFQKGLAHPGTRVFVEHHRKVLLPEAGMGYGRLRVVRQGDHMISVYQAALGELGSQ